MNLFEKFGLYIPEVLLPRNTIDLKAWAVIACDQYTQDKAYWEKAGEIAKGKKSTLHIMLPEVYLNEGGESEKATYIKRIHTQMRDYVESDVFAPPVNSMIYVERNTAYGRCRKGLVATIDLEQYNWEPFSKTPIRSTEATIIDRIPPRIAIRKGAPIETPHIMLLVNDPHGNLVEKTGELAKKKTALYDTDLMLNGGHISGWAVQGETALEGIQKALESIARNNTAEDGSVFLFAAGDGNHSLATAKTVWDEVKKTKADHENCNERYALVEIVNIYDEGLTFEPIHRVIFNVDAEKLCAFLQKKLGAIIIDGESAQDAEKFVSEKQGRFALVFQREGQTVYRCFAIATDALVVSALQPVLDAFLAGIQKTENGSATGIDYIHGRDEVFRLAKQEGAASILMPPIAKDAFFTTIVQSGPLPRKSFSMGEADEKRFYMECRRLF